jgi:hypothetical protein
MARSSPLASALLRPSLMLADLAALDLVSFEEPRADDQNFTIHIIAAQVGDRTASSLNG